MAEPVTEAGRALLGCVDLDLVNYAALGGPEDAILAIEQEARAALLAELRAAVEGLPGWPVFAEEHEPTQRGNLIDRAAVLEAMEAMQRALGS